MIIFKLDKENKRRKEENDKRWRLKILSPLLWAKIWAKLTNYLVKTVCGEKFVLFFYSIDYI